MKCAANLDHSAGFDPARFGVQLQALVRLDESWGLRQAHFVSQDDLDDPIAASYAHIPD